MINVQDLPALNAGLNGLAAVLLLAGYRAIRRGQKDQHRRFMIAAFVTSALFLVGYLTYHLRAHALTRFLEPAWFRPVYLGILLTHTILAALVVPLVLTTITLALRGHFERHRAVARWTWPVWMYVSVTGVLIYLLLYRIFPQAGTGALPAP